MRLFISAALALVFFANSFAQNSSNDKINITLKNPELSMSAGVSPHYSTFHVGDLDWESNSIRKHYRSMKFTPLTTFKFRAGANGITVNYSLLTTFPFQPKYDIYERSGDILNTATYEEWIHQVGIESNLFRNFSVGLSYHDRTIRFRDYDSKSTVEFEYNLQSQQNLLFSAENSFALKSFSVKPSVSYSLRQWRGPGSNYFTRNNPNERKLKDYQVPITELTDYFGVGFTLRNEEIAKNVSLNFRYDSFSNTMIENNRYLFSINYEFDVLERILNLK
jgi:hypothetical protein